MNNLRPTNFKDIIGQEDIKSCLNISIESAKKRNDVLSHTLLQSYGPGLGKTTMALAIANELGKKAYLTNGGSIRKVKDVLPYLTRLKRGDILFIDEIHRVKNNVQEALFTVMEDFRLDITKGAHSIEFSPFTLIGATTDPGLLLRPFYDRFIHKFTLEYYTIDELSSIIRANAQKLQINIDDLAIKEIANRSRFTPRVANSHLIWCRDYADVNRIRLDIPTVEKAFSLKKIDRRGLDNADNQYIMALKASKKPLGLNTIASITGLSKETIEHQIEPYLLKLGIIEKLNLGRKLR